MSPFFARFFLVIYLFSVLVPAQVQKELGKFPQLLAHFKMHKIEKPSTTFLEFWAEHYGVGFEKHQSEHDHSDLPGKDNGHVHSILCANNVVALPNDLPIFLAPGFVSEVNRAFFRESNLLVSRHLSCIWQPPKSC